MGGGVRLWLEQELGATGSGVNLVADCVACGKAQHLYVNAHSGLAYCFVCGYKANLVKLVKDLRGVSWPQARKEAYAVAQQELVVRKKTKPSILDTVQDIINGVSAEDVEKFDLPSGCTALMQPGGGPTKTLPTQVAYKYLVNRFGAAPNRDEDYKGLYAWTPYPFAPHKAYVLFPDYDEHGKLQYWTSRATFPEADRKCFNPRGKKHRLFGVQHLVTDEPLLVEGPMDWLALKGYSVATLGKSMSANVLEEVAQRWRKVCVALDADATQEAYTVARELRKRGVWASVVTWWTLPGTDPAELAANTALPPKGLASLLASKASPAGLLPPALSAPAQTP